MLPQSWVNWERSRQNWEFNDYLAEAAQSWGLFPWIVQTQLSFCHTNVQAQGCSHGIINRQKLTFQISFKACWIFKVAAFQGCSLCVGTQHLHPLQVCTLAETGWESQGCEEKYQKPAEHGFEFCTATEPPKHNPRYCEEAGKHWKWNNHRKHQEIDSFVPIPIFWDNSRAGQAPQGAASLHPARIPRGQLSPGWHSTGWRGPGCSGSDWPS